MIEPFYKSMLKKDFIANYITLGNLFFGILAIYFIMQSNMVFAIISIGCAIIFDFMDGAVARLLKISSPFGKELDSLSDAISFGLAPALLITKFIFNSEIIGLICAFIITGSVVLRLARFNLIDSTVFIGMPSPLFAIFACAYSFSQFSFPLYIHFLILSSVAILMISELRFPSLKKKIFLKFKIGSFILAILILLFLDNVLLISILYLFLIITFVIIRKNFKSTYILFIIGFSGSVFFSILYSILMLPFLYSCIAVILVREK